MLKHATLLIVYALVLIGLGIVAYLLAPEGAAATTALAIPVAFAVLTLAAAALCITGRGHDAQGKPKKAGMIGVHVGLVLPLLFTALIAARAVPTTTGVLNAQAQLAEAGTLERSAREALGDESFFETQEAAAKDYLAMALWGLSGVSVSVFVAMVLMRPAPAKSVPQA